jgi:secreted trypsin-like serine protease
MFFYYLATLLNKRYALTAMHCVQDAGVLASSAVVSTGIQYMNPAPPQNPAPPTVS